MTNVQAIALGMQYAALYYAIVDLRAKNDPDIANWEEMYNTFWDYPFGVKTNV